MLVIPVAITPTGGRSFAESAGRHEHRPHIFLALPHRSFRDWRNGKCRDHALPLPFSNRRRADETTAATATTSDAAHHSARSAAPCYRHRRRGTSEHPAV